MAQIQEKLNNAVNKLVEDVDKKFFRNLQKSCYLCSAKCFDNKNMSSEQTQHCVERCQQPAAQAQNLLNSELTSFQNRLQRCAMDCQDKIRDQLPANGDVSDDKMAKLHSMMEACAENCASDHIKLLSNIQSRIEQGIKQLS